MEDCLQYGEQEDYSVQVEGLFYGIGNFIFSGNIVYFKLVGQYLWQYRGNDCVGFNEKILYCKFCSVLF